MLSILQGDLFHYIKILFLTTDDRRKVHHLVFIDNWCGLGQALDVWQTLLVDIILNDLSYTHT